MTATYASFEAAEKATRILSRLYLAGQKLSVHRDGGRNSSKELTSKCHAYFSSYIIGKLTAPSYLFYVDR